MKRNSCLGEKEEESEEVIAKKTQSKKAKQSTLAFNTKSSKGKEKAIDDAEQGEKGTASTEKPVFVSKELADGGLIHFCESFLTKEQADAVFAHIMTTSSWVQSDIKIWNKTFKSPRLQAWMSDPGRDSKSANLYQSSKAIPWTAEILQVKSAIEDMLENRATFDYVLFNLYRDGKDHIGFHCDSEAINPSPVTGKPRNIIASVSLGEPRRFVLRHKTKKDLPKEEYLLTHGSLIIMAGKTQEFWKHSVPKMARAKNPRINLTFRMS